jgi:hypothetical protein
MLAGLSVMEQRLPAVSEHQYVARYSRSAAAAGVASLKIKPDIVTDKPAGALVRWPAAGVYGRSLRARSRR